MRAKILILMLTVLFAIPTFAQKHHEDREARYKEMMEFKLKTLADELDLNDSQRKQFNEVYMQMETERRAIFKKIKETEKSIASKQDASDAEYEKASREISAYRDQMIQVDKKYEEKFASFLTKKQIYKLKEAEDKFMEKMRKCRDKRKKEK